MPDEKKNTTASEWAVGRPPQTLPPGHYLLCVEHDSWDAGYRNWVYLYWHGEATYPPDDWGEFARQDSVKHWRPISLELPEGWQRPALVQEPEVKP